MKYKFFTFADSENDARTEARAELAYVVPSKVAFIHIQSVTYHGTKCDVSEYEVEIEADEATINLIKPYFELTDEIGERTYWN